MLYELSTKAKTVGTRSRWNHVISLVGSSVTCGPAEEHTRERWRGCGALQDYEFMRRMVGERDELNLLPNWSFAMPMAAANSLPKASDGPPQPGAPPQSLLLSEVPGLPKAPHSALLKVSGLSC